MERSELVRVVQKKFVIGGTDACNGDPLSEATFHFIEAKCTLSEDHLVHCAGLALFPPPLLQLVQYHCLSLVIDLIRHVVLNSVRLWTLMWSRNTIMFHCFPIFLDIDKSNHVCNIRPFRHQSKNQWENFWEILRPK